MAGHGNARCAPTHSPAQVRPRRTDSSQRGCADPRSSPHDAASEPGPATPTAGLTAPANRGRGRLRQGACPNHRARLGLRGERSARPRETPSGWPAHPPPAAGRRGGRLFGRILHVAVQSRLTDAEQRRHLARTQQAQAHKRRRERLLGQPQRQRRTAAKRGQALGSPRRTTGISWWRELGKRSLSSASGELTRGASNSNRRARTPNTRRSESTRRRKTFRSSGSWWGRSSGRGAEATSERESPSHSPPASSPLAPPPARESARTPPRGAPPRRAKRRPRSEPDYARRARRAP